MNFTTHLYVVHASLKNKYKGTVHNFTSVSIRSQKYLPFIQDTQQKCVYTCVNVSHTHGTLFSVVSFHPQNSRQYSNLNKTTLEK